MKRLFLITVFVSACLLVPTHAKAQGIGSCVEINNGLIGSCVCNGVTYHVSYSACGILSSAARCASASVQIQCCPNKYILGASVGDTCSGPKSPVKLAGFVGGETVYLRACNGQYVPVRVIGTDGV